LRGKRVTAAPREQQNPHEKTKHWNHQDEDGLSKRTLTALPRGGRARVTHNAALRLHGGRSSEREAGDQNSQEHRCHDPLLFNHGLSSYTQKPEIPGAKVVASRQ
jgi:hypothetical protein